MARRDLNPHSHDGMGDHRVANPMTFAPTALPRCAPLQGYPSVRPTDWMTHHILTDGWLTPHPPRSARPATYPGDEGASRPTARCPQPWR